MNRRSHQRSDPAFIREGGEGLPPNPEKEHDLENDCKTWLFTCLECGKRWCNPPAPVSRCSCGGDITAHRFDPAEYSRIRWYGDPRDFDGQQSGGDGR
ncbi:hypothetical protein [Natronomonas marina]|uniref:hypothetical protein n=1 Tax=Natronomonas marina TaxID=2961939 RepID=UPI0020C93EBD|nr:hypothetical protein [Natronomonas marina]